VSRSGERINDSGDGIRVLVLCVGGGILGIGGTSACARVVPVRRAPGTAVCRVLSRGSPPDIAFTRVATEVVRFEDTEVVRDEGGTRDAGDCAGEVDTFVRWRGVVAGLRFVALFGADVVRTRVLIRWVVGLLVFASDISVLRVDPDRVR
jgi:hypothetical protein